MWGELNPTTTRKRVFCHGPADGLDGRVDGDLESFSDGFDDTSIVGHEGVALKKVRAGEPFVKATGAERKTSTYTQ